jgi:hypothetical protein
MGLHRTPQTDSSMTTGLVCTHCESFFCKPCLSKMLHKTRLDPSSDQWAHEVSTFLSTGLSQPFFTGSCCEFLVISNKASSDHRMASIPRTYVSKTSSAAKGASYDGYLHYPEYHLLVESNFRCIDILALGEQHGLDPGVLHGLVSPEDALEYQQAGVVATGLGLRCLDSFEKTLGSFGLAFEEKSAASCKSQLK